MQAEALCATPPQANHTVTPTHIEPEQYNSLNNDIIKASDIKLVSLYSTIKMMHGPINIRFTENIVKQVINKIRTKLL